MTAGGGVTTKIDRGLFVKSSTLYSCALLLFGLTALANAGPRTDIERLETDFNAAYAANDLDKYFGYYSADAILWFPEGRTDLPSYKKEWTEFVKSGGKILACTMSDKHLRFSPQGDTAIASYLLNVKTQAKDKKVTDDVFQETDVWFKAAGGWKIAHVHYSLPPPAAPK
jgi:ketosteroid isomerase-like protein